MSVYSDSELDFLREKGRLGRLATVGPDGGPQVRPVVFLVDPDTGSIDVPGRRNPATQKWRNVIREPKVSFVVDDTGPQGTWRPRVVEIRGTAEALPDEHPRDAFPGVEPGVIRIRPRRILSFVDGVRNDRTLAAT